MCTHRVVHVAQCNVTLACAASWQYGFYFFKVITGIYLKKGNTFKQVK